VVTRTMPPGNKTNITEWARACRWSGGAQNATFNASKLRLSTQPPHSVFRLAHAQESGMSPNGLSSSGLW
jgi:hypothetical protein